MISNYFLAKWTFSQCNQITKLKVIKSATQSMAYKVFSWLWSAYQAALAHLNYRTHTGKSAVITKKCYNTHIVKHFCIFNLSNLIYSQFDCFKVKSSVTGTD